MEMETHPSVDEPVGASEQESEGSSNPFLRPDPTIPRWRFVCLTTSVCMGLFLSMLDTTIVATALYTIGVDLKSISSINWVALAYTLSYLSCAVVFTRAADIVGRRNAYIAAFLIFFGFSLGCGFAQNLNQLIAFRCLQGVGGSGLYSLTILILIEISTVTQMQMIGALAGAVVAVSGVLGPVLGGVITRYTTWRWIFLINAPIGIIPLIVFTLAWPPSSQLIPAPLRPWKQFDLLSTLLLICGSILTIYPFQQAGINALTTPRPFTTALFLAPLLTGILCWFLLLAWEYFVYTRPPTSRSPISGLATMFPIRLLKKRVYFGHWITTLLMGFSYFVIIYALPLRLQVVNGKSPLVAGLELLPMLAGVAVSSAVGGTLNSKKDRIFWSLLSGSSFMLVGIACMISLDSVAKVEARMYGFEVFIGLGFGLMVSTVSVGAALECEGRDRTVSQGIIAQARILGGSLGIAASSTILGTIQKSQLVSTNLVSASELKSLQANAKFMTIQQLEAVRQAYSDAFKRDMKVCAAVGVACVLGTAITFRWHPRTIGDRIREQSEGDERLKSDDGKGEKSEV